LSFICANTGYNANSPIKRYCISSQEADSYHEDTTIDINEIECVTCEVEVEVAEEDAEEYSQGKLNLISKY
jgi:hypothetical protein